MSHRRQRLALEPKPAHQLSRNVLGVGGAAPISHQQNFVALPVSGYRALRQRPHRLQGFRREAALDRAAFFNLLPQQLQPGFL